MEPQTFLLYSGLPKTSYHYYHLRVADEDRKVNLCNLCHDFPYLNHCNSIASLEILANSIPTGNRELLGVIFFLSPVILPFDRDNIPFQLASQPKRFQFVLRADDKTSSHRWRRIIYFILGQIILGFQTWFMDSFTPAYLKGNFKANWMLEESHWHIISWFSLTGHAMIGIQGRISQPVFCSTAHNSALKHMTIRNNCRFPETFWIWLANNHPQTICIHADTNFGELIRRMIDNFMTTRPILANCT